MVDKLNNTKLFRGHVQGLCAAIDNWDLCLVFSHWMDDQTCVVLGTAGGILMTSAVTYYSQGWMLFACKQLTS